MSRPRALLAIFTLASLHGQSLEKLTGRKSGVFHLPSGRLEVHREIQLPADAHDLTIQGDRTTLHAASDFQGRALLSCQGCRNLSISNVTLDGNRAALEQRKPIAPSDVPFSKFHAANGFLCEDCRGVSLDHVDFTDIAGFAVLTAHSSNILLDHMQVRNSGSRNAKGRNNTTGGVLLEEGTEDFTVADSTFQGIRGNAVWTHSRYKSPRNVRGRIANNKFFDIGRDAIQIGHASEVQVAGNSGARIGLNAAEVDVENGGTPVGIDTAGNVDRSTYEYNRFEEINGKCIDLDGFHDGAIRGNTCVNRGKPDDYAFGHFGIVLNNASIEMESRNIVIEGNTLDGMKFGGIFVIGSGHRVVRNTMRRLNTAHCNESRAKFGCVAIPGEPDLLASGIYLGKRAERPDPARNVTIEGNTISGWKMGRNCVVAGPGIKLSDNRIRGNHCADE